MNRVVVTDEAAEDAEQILDFLYREAGAAVAEEYASRFDSIVARLSRFPETGVARPDLGSDARIAVVAPYVMIYDFKPRDRMVILLRILHGSRDISERLLRH